MKCAPHPALALGNAAKAREKLGWTHRTTLKMLVAEMVAADIHAVEREKMRRDRLG